MNKETPTGISILSLNIQSACFSRFILCIICRIYRDTGFIDHSVNDCFHCTTFSFISKIALKIYEEVQFNTREIF